MSLMVASSVKDVRSGRRRRMRGGAVLEMALLSPWIFFLAVGALDWGFYGYALISVQSAVRSAVLYTSSSTATVTDIGKACTIVLGELSSLPNIGTASNPCDTNPLVTATSVTGPDSAAAAQVSVRYQSITMIPLPGYLTKQFTVTRIGKMRVRSTT